MKIRKLQLAATLATATAAVLIAAEIVNTTPDGLTVHEWGTFTSVAGEDGAPVDWDALGGKDDLPTFVHSYGYRCFKFRLQGTVRMETPVLYFYSRQETNARVNVQFPRGVISEWYPKGNITMYQSKKLMDRMPGTNVEGPAYPTESLLKAPPRGFDSQLVKLGTNINGFDTSLRNLMSTISWNSIKIQPGAMPDLPTTAGKSRYYAARATDAAPISVGDQHEKFIFYRGVGHFPIPLSARLQGEGKVDIQNTASEPVPIVILFENRGGHLGYRTTGVVSASMTLDRPALDGNLPQLQSELERVLEAQGLFGKEAHAMVETWRDSWFEEGTRLIYIVPSHMMDTSLPLQVEPSPLQTNRVFVGRIELITPEMKRTVEDAVAKNDVSVSRRYGRFLEPILQRVSAQNPAIAARLDQFRQEVGKSLAGEPCR
jgi:hypothetical protein